MRKFLAAFLYLVAIAALASAFGQTLPTPTYNGVVFAPQGGTPAGVVNGQCWSQSTGYFCYIAGGVTGPFLTAASGGVSTTGSPASGNLTKFSGAASITNGDLSGDVTTSGTLATTLATVNANTGTWGDGTHVGAFTVNGKGLITAASSVTITGAAPTGAAGGGLAGSYPNPTVATNANLTGDVTSIGNATTLAGGSATNLNSGTLPAARLPALTGDATTSVGTVATTVGKVNGVTYPSAPSANTVPVVTSAAAGGTVTYEAVPNAALANSSVTVNGSTCTLGSSCTPIAGGLVVGSTAIGAGTNTRVLFDNSGALGEYSITGTGSVVMNTSPTIASPTVTGAFTATGLVTNADLANSSMTLAGHSVALGGTQTFACADLSNGATGCSTATGTSGATIPLLNGTNVWSGQQSVTPTSLAISTATFTPDGTSNNYTLTLVHASCPCTLANPSATPVAGTGGQIVVKQSATGSDTIGTYGSQYEASGGTSTLTLSTAANAVDILSYYVRDATHIELSLLTNFSH